MRVTALLFLILSRWMNNQKCLIVAPHYQILVQRSVTEWYHSLSHTLQPQPILTLWYLLPFACICVWVCVFMCVSRMDSGGFSMVSSEHPCVYSSTKVSKTVATLLFLFLLSTSIHQSAAHFYPCTPQLIRTHFHEAIKCIHLHNNCIFNHKLYYSGQVRNAWALTFISCITALLICQR